MMNPSEAHESAVVGGHKANISNPTTSIESKKNSEHVLKDEFGVNGKPAPRPSSSLYRY